MKLGYAAPDFEKIKVISFKMVMVSNMLINFIRQIYQKGKTSLYFRDIEMAYGN